LEVGDIVRLLGVGAHGARVSDEVDLGLKPSTWSRSG
jgi:hypothetical protein